MFTRSLRLLSTLMLGAALTFGQVSLAFAGPATDTVKSKQDSLRDILKQPSPDQKKMAAIFDATLNYDALAEGSLGSEWAARSDAEKAEFSGLLKQLVRRSYERNLKKTIDYDIEYVSEDAGSNSSIIVKTRAKSRANPNEDPIEVSYKLVQKDGTWLIHDIVTEGVSLVGSYRSQFVKIIKRDGFPKLIQKMKDKLAKGDV
jgi:phospholipid transport system substrate-binding protein